MLSVRQEGSAVSAYRLISGAARSRENPETFVIPTEQERRNIPVGAFVKLMFEADGWVERMWVKVTERVPGGYAGHLDNDPCLIPITCGTRVEFKARHVIDIILRLSGSPGSRTPPCSVRASRAGPADT